MIELTNYMLAPQRAGNGLKPFTLLIKKGEVYSIDTDSSLDAHLLLKTLALLELPLSGGYRFMAKAIDFSSYRKLLPFKKRIAYIASDSGILSNRTIKENLLFMRYCYENSLNLELDQNTQQLCHIFKLTEKLDKRPTEMNLRDVRIAVAIRELIKSPQLILLERPEDFIAHKQFERFESVLADLLTTKLPLVFLSWNKRFVKRFATQKIRIKNGQLTYA